MVYRGGDNFSNTSGLRFEKDGITIKSGYSLNTNPTDPFVQQFGGAYTMDKLPAGLKIEITSGTHYHILPINRSMSVSEYQSLINQIKLTLLK